MIITDENIYENKVKQRHFNPPKQKNNKKQKLFSIMTRFFSGKREQRRRAKSERTNSKIK